jgi:hypothetical protein
MENYISNPGDHTRAVATPRSPPRSASRSASASISLGLGVAAVGVGGEILGEEDSLTGDGSVTPHRSWAPAWDRSTKSIMHLAAKKATSNPSPDPAAKPLRVRRPIAAPVSRSPTGGPLTLLRGLRPVHHLSRTLVPAPLSRTSTSPSRIERSWPDAAHSQKAGAHQRHPGPVGPRAVESSHPWHTTLVLTSAPRSGLLPHWKLHPAASERSPKVPPPRLRLQPLLEGRSVHRHGGSSGHPAVVLCSDRSPLHFRNAWPPLLLWSSNARSSCPDFV